MAGIEASPELVALGAGGPVAEEIRGTIRAMLRVEERMAEIAFEMAAADRHPVRGAALVSTVCSLPRNYVPWFFTPKC